MLSTKRNQYRNRTTARFVLTSRTYTYKHIGVLFVNDGKNVYFYSLFTQIICLIASY